MIGPKDNRNIIVKQIFSDDVRKSVKDVKPFFYDRKKSTKALCVSNTLQLMWYPIIDGASSTDDNQFSIFKNVTENKINLRSIVPGKNVKLSYEKNGSLRIDFKESNNNQEYIQEHNIENYIEAGNNIQLKKLDNGKIQIHTKNNILDNKGRFNKSNIYFLNDRIGLGRKPNYDYKLDIDISKNKSRNAIHIGDGTYGFSIGNGTTDGFLPQITGIGLNSHDAGLYLIGKESRTQSSDIPLIILDGRDKYNKKLQNRPILGVTSGDYENFDFLINNDGKIGINKKPGKQRVETGGNIKANDFILSNNLSVNDLYQIVREQQEKIYKLYDLIENIIEKM